MASIGTATAAVATAPTPVTADQRFHYGGYNRAGRAYGSRGACNGIPFGKDANQDARPNGQHFPFRYLQGMVCVPNLPNALG
ncbi:hypothetical protein [Streptomyces silvisoli]|uniref:Secreted protein n=1 Tax=Streptomyces silvisoli TaxID=3034235 RepID=A0ABT5ZLW8_9ACTN|nr:hypothetical protein [Streptomyces silvisoli]MDF3290676.1 hypothetical protein [Streptomyces silvisoli]